MPSRRCIGFLVVLALAFALVGVRLTQLQVVAPESYARAGEAQRLRTLVLPAERGTIFDRGGHELAMSVRTQTVWADPRLVEDPTAAARAVAPVLGVDEGWLADRLSVDGKFVYLARQVDDELARRVEALDVPGIALLDESSRFRPGGDLAASILGATDIDNKGTAGLELLHEDRLVGEPGELLLERGIDGRTIPAGQHELSPAERGDDLVLTIDRALQYEVERALGEQIVATGSAGGVAVVSDPRTGEILAMANMSGADDATPAGTPADGGPGGDPARARPSRHNKAVTDAFEPGSVLKVVAAAAALEEGVRTPDQAWHIPPTLSLPGKRSPFSDAHPIPGQGTVRDVLTRSSNVGMIQLAQELGPERLHEYLRRFGFGDPTGLGFPNETRGIVHHPEQWSGPSIGTIAIGQGVAVNALQLLGAFNVVANGGELVEPSIVRATIDAEGTERPAEPGERRRVVSEETALAMRSMLTDVVASEEGTGRRAQVTGYSVAGKTGTARRPRTDGGPGYEPGAYVATFAGFVPAEDPRLSIVVVLDRPQPFYAGIVSAPVFAEIAQYALRQFRIPPPAGETFVPPPTAVPEGTPVPRD